MSLTRLGRANQTESRRMRQFMKLRDAAEWSCPTCTYLNKISDDSCEMCQTKRPAQQKHWVCDVCGFTNPMTADNCSKCQSNRAGIQKAMSHDFMMMLRLVKTTFLKILMP